MKKIILVFLFLALSSLISFFIFPHKAFAVCEVNVDPNPIEDKFNGNVTLSAIDDTCLGVGLRYTIFAYPKDRTLDTLKPLTSVKGGALSNDGQTLEVSLDFNDIISGGGRGPSTLKPHNPGPWTVLVCSSNKCDDNDRIAEGEFNLISIPPTPTPTPPSDLPIIDHTKQEACTFQLSYDQSSITIKVQNIDPSKKYVWWWDTNFNKEKRADLNLIPQDTPSLTTTPSPSPAPPLYELKIPKTELRDLRNQKDEKGHLLCIDIKDKVIPAKRQQSEQRRTGVNCLRLFFTSGKPEGNTDCTEANSGEVSPTPKPNLSPCSNWVYFNNTSVPTPEPNGTQEEYIRQNNLRSQIKCATIDTAIGSIRTDPFEFVKSIMSVLLGLAGGIAVILIIVSGYKLMTSQGNPEAVKAAQEQLTSAIVGLLFIIFSLVILQVIGVDILKIPGFGR